MFVNMGVIYLIIRGFGSEAQAGFGLGSRVMQAIFLPAMAVAFATAPLAGQNFGARKLDRVRETFISAAVLGTAIMAVLTVLCRWRPEAFFTGFTQEAPVVAVGAGYLRMVSWNFAASGLIFICSGMFQALGNTVPSLISSASRIFLFAIPAVWLSGRPGFALAQLWQLSVATVTLKALFSIVLLKREYDRKVAAGTAPAPFTAPPALAGEA